jgi:SAM-dependent methyltransferase
MIGSETENDEAALAWNTVLFDKFLRFKHLVTLGLGRHGDALIARRPPAAGARVLDIGCGFGDTTRLLARYAGDAGEAVGVDVAQNFVDASAREAEQAAARNVRFFRADVQFEDLGGPYAAAYSRFGTMFFASPVAALRNVKKSLALGGQLAIVVWRRREDNPWVYLAEQCVRELIPENHESDEPTCGPGPFSMQSPDLVSSQLLAAGFRQIAFERHDADICIGRDIDEALEFAMALGPAGELIRVAGDLGREKTPEITAALRAVLSPYESAEGVMVPSSTWIITAQCAP